MVGREKNEKTCKPAHKFSRPVGVRSKANEI